VCFSPDGKRLISTDARGNRLVWDISTRKVLPGATDPIATPGQRSPDGQRFALGQGNVIRLHRLRPPTAEELVEGRRWVEPDFTWHAAEARTSEAAGQWFAAAFRLLPSRPWDAGVHARLAYARARLGQPQPATLHYLHALTLNPHARLWPEAPEASRRGEAAAAVGDWPTAATEFRLAAHQPGAPLSAWENLLLARRALAPKNDAPLNCREILDRFENTPALAVQVLDSCRITACDESDARRLVHVAERLVASRRDADSLSFLGGALYRAGRLEEATRTLRESIKLHGQGGFAATRVFLAMAEQRLGRGKDASSDLARFEEWLKDRTFPTWQSTTHWRLLHEEAKALVNTPPPMPRVAPGD
jgi:tetratricopeptide (TPR) repeat protein